jgi:isopenicillin-N N-acyltransferase-like protein
VARALIDQPDLESARNFLHRVVHASGINYMIADGDSVEDYECSTNQVHRCLPMDGSLRLAHTNHPLASPDRINTDVLQEDTRILQQRSNEHSLNRITCLSQSFLGEKGPADVPAIQQVLSSHEPPDFPVCRHYQPDADPMTGMTNNSLIMVMTRPPEMHLTSGPPCMSEFVKLVF